MEQNEFLKTHNYKSWEIKDSEDYDWEKVSYDGHSYVIMSDNSRFDNPQDLYREERLLWNSLKNEKNIFIKIGRWIITEEGIETKKENNEIRKFNNEEIWSYEKKGEKLVYAMPVNLCSLAWISNLDLLDFNNSLLVYQEIHKKYKPENLPEISWSETLKRQYKRFQNSLDINSFNGRKQYEFETEYRQNLSFEDMMKITQINPNNESNEIEVFGDELSRKY